MAIDGCSTWQRFAVDLGAREAWYLVVLLCYVCTAAAWVAWNDGFAFKSFTFDVRLASVVGAPHAVVHASEAGLLAHFGVIALIGGAIVIELRTGVFTTALGPTAIALRSAPRTVVDVLQTLPVVLTVFFVAHSHDTWGTFGRLTAPHSCCSCSYSSSASSA